MVYQWEPWTQYGHDAVVEYQGHLYQIIQPHRSEPNWEPPNTPALWSRLPEESCHQYRSGETHHGVEEHHRYQGGDNHPGGPGGAYDNRPQPGGWGHNEHKHDGDSSDDENREGWLDEKRKHQLQVGGGILGALAIGGGIFAYSKHKKEEAKKQAWLAEASHDKWIQGAHAHTQHYLSGGQSPPVFWVLVDRNDPIPNNAIEGGREGGHSLYIGRVFYNSGLHVGKVSPHLGGCVIGWGGKEHNEFPKFEILCGDKNAVRWINHASHQDAINCQGFQPVEGGREADGRFLFVCQVQHEGGVHPCKAADGSDYCIFSYGGKEHTKKEFNILVYS